MPQGFASARELQAGNAFRAAGRRRLPAETLQNDHARVWDVHQEAQNAQEL
jgi:hypothetical protein